MPGPDGAPDYPLPWARDPSYSFLVAPERARADVEAAGFRVTEFRDGSKSPARADRARAVGGQPDPAPAGPLTIEIIRGDDYPTRRANSSKGVIEGRLISILLVAEKST